MVCSPLNTLVLLNDEVLLRVFANDGLSSVSIDMKEHLVIDPLISKRQKILLPTQLCRMVLKVNNVIVAGSEDSEF